MNRYHLTRQKKGDIYYICDTQMHGYCEFGDGKVHISSADDLERLEGECEEE